MVEPGAAGPIRPWGHTMVVNIKYNFLSLDLIPKWLTRDIG